MPAIVQEIPRAAVRLGVKAARLPLTATESALGLDDAWPPALAFDSAAAQVKTVAGTLLRDDALLEEGRLVRAKVQKLRQAEQLEVLAEERRAEADDELSTARQRANEQRQAARQTAAKRKTAAQKRAEEAERKATEAAERQEARVREAAEEARNAVNREARREREAALAKEEKALAKEQAAVARTRRAARADDAISASKQARSTKR